MAQQGVIVGVIGVSVPSVADVQAINNATAMPVDTQAVLIELCHLHGRFRGPRGRHNGERHACR